MEKFERGVRVFLGFFGFLRVCKIMWGFEGFEGVLRNFVEATGKKECFGGV